MTTVNIIANANITSPISLIANNGIEAPLTVIPSVGPKGRDADGVISNNEQVVTGIENVTTFDSFLASDYRMMKYLISISKTSGGDNKFYGTELSILVDGNGVSVNEYGTVDNDGDMGTISVSLSGDSVNLILTPAPGITPVTVRYARIGLKA